MLPEIGGRARPGPTGPPTPSTISSSTKATMATAVAPPCALHFAPGSASRPADVASDAARFGQLGGGALLGRVRRGVPGVRVMAVMPALFVARMGTVTLVLGMLDMARL